MVVALFASRVADAQVEAVPYGDPKPAGVDSTPRGQTDYFHDGLYLRLAAGVSWLHLRRHGDLGAKAPESPYASDSSASGLGLIVEAWLGGSPKPGLSVAGVLAMTRVDDLELNLDNGQRFVFRDALTLILVGAGIAWYPDPAGGFSISGTLGAAVFDAELEAEELSVVGGLGPAAAADAGYELWIGTEWSLGLRARVSGTIGIGSTEQNFAGTTFSAGSADQVFGGGLLLQVLYH